ncbi:hypothetical protein [Lysobacter sp. CA199]|uniref:hypothetical protein n=1 Tax=Lysobacter sp. CA199 TaxID=3455608 RepID=UPI003F8CFE12
MNPNDSPPPSAGAPMDPAASPVGGLELHAMAALLAQGRWLCVASLTLWASGLFGLCLSTAVPGSQFALLMLSLAAGVVQLYYALRVDFDARLLRALARTGDGAADAAAARRLDAALSLLGLLKPGREGRDWASRWRGARGLLLRQASMLIVQLVALIGAYGRVWI